MTRARLCVLLISIFLAAFSPAHCEDEESDLVEIGACVFLMYIFLHISRHCSKICLKFYKTSTARVERLTENFFFFFMKQETLQNGTWSIFVRGICPCKSSLAQGLHTTCKQFSERCKAVRRQVIGGQGWYENSTRHMEFSVRQIIIMCDSWRRRLPCLFTVFDLSYYRSVRLLYISRAISSSQDFSHLVYLSFSFCHVCHDIFDYSSSHYIASAPRLVSLWCIH